MKKLVSLILTVCVMAGFAVQANAEITGPVSEQRTMDGLTEFMVVLYSAAELPQGWDRWKVVEFVQGVKYQLHKMPTQRLLSALDEIIVHVSDRDRRGMSLAKFNLVGETIMALLISEANEKPGMSFDDSLKAFKSAYDSIK